MPQFAITPPDGVDPEEFQLVLVDLDKQRQITDMFNDDDERVVVVETRNQDLFPGLIRAYAGRNHCSWRKLN